MIILYHVRPNLSTIFYT